MTTDAPLKNILVLDFSTLLPGPMATLMLAEAGATVIKIERPESGDGMRREAADFAMLNRGMKSIALDLKAPQALDQLRPLLLKADIIVEQFRPGVMDRLGLGYQALKQINPGIIYCSINGYGSDGPAAMKTGHDLNYAAEAGLLAQTSASDGAPVMPPTMIGDIGGGTYPAVMNILLALFRRQQSGQGEQIEISMFRNIFPFLYPAYAAAFGRNHWALPNDAMETGASPRYHIYPTRDGRYIAAAPSEQKFWLNFCAAIKLPEIFIDDAINPAATKQAVTEIIAQRDASEWQAIFADQDVVCSVVLSFEEAMHSPQVRSLALTARQVQFNATTFPALPIPVVANLCADSELMDAPELGQDNHLLAL